MVVVVGAHESLQIRCCVIPVSPIINEQIHRYKKCLVVVIWNNNFSCVLFYVLFELLWSPRVIVADGFLKGTLLCYSCLPNNKRTDPPLQEVFSGCEMDETITSRVFCFICSGWCGVLGLLLLMGFLKLRCCVIPFLQYYTH